MMGVGRLIGSPPVTVNDSVMPVERLPTFGVRPLSRRHLTAQGRYPNRVVGFYIGALR